MALVSQNARSLLGAALAEDLNAGIGAKTDGMPMQPQLKSHDNFRAGLLKPQDDVLQFSGVAANGVPEIASAYPFRVVK